MDGSSYGPARIDGFGFQPGRDHVIGCPPAPTPTPNPGPDPLLEREWGLSAGQVAAAVLAIVALCELIGVLS